MDRTTLRGAAFWTAVATSLITLMISGIYAILPFASSNMDIGITYQVISVFSLFIHVFNTGSLMLFLGLVHYDLTTAQRLSEHARDYIIRDLSQSTQPNNPPQSRF